MLLASLQKCSAQGMAKVVTYSQTDGFLQPSIYMAPLCPQSWKAAAQLWPEGSRLSGSKKAANLLQKDSMVCGIPSRQRLLKVVSAGRLESF